MFERVNREVPITGLRWSIAHLNDASEATLARMQALGVCTLGTAWFAHDDANRGSLAVGKLADVAVLSKDYLSVPLEEVAGISSLLTMVGGRVVYAEGPYAKFEQAVR